MGTEVALEHRTSYRFDRPTDLGPHLIRLRPAPHCRTTITGYTLDVAPVEHKLSWLQDPYGNFVARAVFDRPATELTLAVSVLARLDPINPFDFFLEPYAAELGFDYPEPLRSGLAPYLDPAAATDPTVVDWLAGMDSTARPTIDFLVALNAAANASVAYSTRMEEGVQTPAHTLSSGVGSCRDSGWLVVDALRSFGLAARFVSGYLVDLGAEESEDRTDLHAWAEVYLPGAGWIGLDPTSGLLTGEGHLPLAATPSPPEAAPISGTTGAAQVSFAYANSVRRFPAADSPGVAPGRRAAAIRRLGELVDERIAATGLELTMGGEPTFVSRTEPTAPEWTVTAEGGRKRDLAVDLARLLADAFATGALIQHGQGRWYPGENAPRWQVGVVWRRDGRALWRRSELLADPIAPGPATLAQAERYARELVSALGLPAEQLQPCLDGERISAWALPLTPAWWGPGWASPRWQPPEGRLVLLPGTLAAGQRLPLDVLAGEPEFGGEDSYLRAGAELEGADPPFATVVELGRTPSRTAVVVELRDGHVHVFAPPLERAEKFAELMTLFEDVAAVTDTAVVVEGYGPPPDPRFTTLLVTPDPGVLEVNLQPSGSWGELAEVTSTLYGLADDLGLGTETFAPDGRRSGTGGGNHWTVGASEPARSPLLRRPDLLVSLITYWQHHPALSYAFAGRFVGPTSQAPRVDEGRPETLYELETAFAEIERLTDLPDGADHQPWLVDRALRHLLTDVTGSTHRSEFCVDKLYSPDSARGRLGLLELRGFEMAPTAELALVQALLIRTVFARCAEEPYAAPLIRWGGRLHEWFLLPHFMAADLAEVVADLRAHGYDFELSWLLPFLDVRCPVLGRGTIDAGSFGTVELELRTAIEPWHVLGQESTSTGTARYVDSSTERLQVLVRGFDPQRFVLTANGRPVPLAPTADGAHVAGVRYRAWRPWSALHPTLAVDTPLTFDLVDLAAGLSRGGVRYHVVDPGGPEAADPPVNARAAEVRRGARFEPSGHTPGAIDLAALAAEQSWRATTDDEAPLTLDLRQHRPRRWGRT